MSPVPRDPSLTVEELFEHIADDMHAVAAAIANFRIRSYETLDEVSRKSLRKTAYRIYDFVDHAALSRPQPSERAIDEMSRLRGATTQLVRAFLSVREGALDEALSLTALAEATCEAIVQRQPALAAQLINRSMPDWKPRAS